MAMIPAAAIALLFGVAGAALVGFFLAQQNTYEPRPGLICTNGSPVDFSRLVGPSAGWKPANPEDLADLREALRTQASQPHGDAPFVQVRVVGTMVPYQIDLIAKKSRSGSWIISLDRHGQHSPNVAAHSDVTLFKDQSGELDQILSNPCLYVEPELIGNEYPTNNGRPGACFDGPNTFVNISFNGRRRAALQACETYGLTGKLAAVIREPFRQ
jgi:hypothetical protein